MAGSRQAAQDPDSDAHGGEVAESPEDRASRLRAEARVARVGRPVGLLMLVLGAGLAVASPGGLALLPLWLLVAAFGFATWRECRHHGAEPGAPTA